MRGIVSEDFVDLTQETHHNLELVANTPSSALGSTRDKPDLAYCQEIFKVLQLKDLMAEVTIPWVLLSKSFFQRLTLTKQTEFQVWI